MRAELGVMNALHLEVAAHVPQWTGQCDPLDAVRTMNYGHQKPWDPTDALDLPCAQTHTEIQNVVGQGAGDDCRSI